jgi:hypothetical protein
MRDRKQLVNDMGLRDRKFKNLNEQETITENGVSSIGVKLALDIDKYMTQDKLKLENSVMKVEKKKNEKRERENIEKNNKEYEDYLIFHNQDLAQSLVREQKQSKDVKLPMFGYGTAY